MKYGLCFLLLALFAGGCGSMSPDQEMSRPRPALRQNEVRVSRAAPRVVAMPLPSTVLPAGPVTPEPAAVAVVESETPLGNPQERLRQLLRLHTPQHCSDTDVKARTCVMEVILGEDYTIQGARMLDGRIFTYDPARSRLEEVVATASTAQVDPWYMAWREQGNQQVLLLCVMLMVLSAAALLCLFRWLKRRPIRRDRGERVTAPRSPVLNGGLITQEHFEALRYAERINMLCAMNALDLDLARDGVLREKRHRDRDERRQEHLEELRTNIFDAHHDMELERCAALETEYDSYRRAAGGDDDEDDNDDDFFFEETPPDDDSIDEDALNNSQTSDEDKKD